MKNIVYIDVLFALNYIIDLIMLCLTAKICKKETSLWRLLIGALMGALYSVIMFFPPLRPLYSFFAKILFSFALIAVTFGFRSFKALFSITGVFYLVSFAFGGAAFALLYFTDAGHILGMLIKNGELYLDVNIGTLFMSVSAAYILFICFTKICRRNYKRERVIFDVSVTLGEKNMVCKALLDTGNTLIDPITKKPVMVLEYERIKGILPPFLADLYEGASSNEFTSISDTFVNECEGFKIRLIPFSALGTESGILLGFVPDKTEIVQIQKNCDIIVGVYKGKLCKDGLYHALINPDIVN